MRHEARQTRLRPASAAAALLLAVLALVPAVAQGARWFSRTRLTLEGAVGLDNNAFRQDDLSGQTPFVPFLGDLRQDVFRSDGYRLRLYGNFRGVRYPEEYEDADRSTLNLKADLYRKVFDGPVGRLGVHATGSWRKHHQVAVSRLAGEEFTMHIEDEEISLRDRFNSSTLAGLLALDYRPYKGIRIIAELESGYRDYDEDYDHVPTVEPLDFHLRNLRLQLSGPVGFGRIRVGYEDADRRYRDYSALDGEGSLVHGVKREYRYREWLGDLSIPMSRGWQLTVRTRFRSRQDLFAGYYDYDQFLAGPVLEGPLSDGWRFMARASLRIREFPRARVFGDPELPLRSERTHVASAELSCDLSSGASAFLGGRGIWHHSGTPGYSYERIRAWFGIRSTWRLN